ncbi:RNA polymerase, sigma 28 subunit, FliA/WhiG subfamily [Paenibacillus algicola]|uniref:RNA polymerase, sigma 28 subunit, FliA/WhiG subfamily n=1 Tax=Paenibacillus algicola TaxID=2565926 RepID=A0A4P8XLL9_9BACL|nr:DUF3310 domain-containing protein [Paenibacillus algicola]QCT03313.1 RNA polymerase, sigma 28 subunit, FliA/WhiG subfamily [Paenibacillus algicola]
MRDNGYSTPVPRRENELRASGPGEVIQYQLSDEELAKYRALPVPQKQGKRPIDLRIANTKAEQQRRRAEMKEENDMPDKKEGPACGLTRENLIEQVAKGETLSSIERAWGMKYNTIHNWVKRWDLKGINQAKAQELLDQAKHPFAARGVEETGCTEPKEVLNSETERLAQENAAMKAENERLLQERDDYKRAAEDLESKTLEYDQFLDQFHEAKEKLNDELELVVKARDEYMRMYQEQYAFAQSYYAECSILKAERDELLIDRSALQDELTPIDSDPVNHPLHYTRGGIECIDAIEAATAGLSGSEAYITGAVIKYLWRWKWKNGREDLQKAAWYIDRLIGGDQLEQAK